jgi:hypothetical protein
MDTENVCLLGKTGSVRPTVKTALLTLSGHGAAQNSGLPRSNLRLQHPGLPCRDVVCFDLDLAWS